MRRVLLLAAYVLQLLPTSTMGAAPEYSVFPHLSLSRIDQEGKG